MEWEKHLLFRTNLNIELYETNTVSEQLIHSYNELGYENIEDVKGYFEFFHWVSKYLLNNNKDFSVFKGVVDKYKATNVISDNDQEFIELSFKINELLLKFDDIANEYSWEIIEEAIQKCSILNVTHKDTLLTLYRLKLRYLLRNVEEMTEDRISKLKVAKSELEALLATTLDEEKQEEELKYNSIFLS